MRTILLRNCTALLLLSAVTFYTYPQCPTGSIGVSGAGCGCLSGCNLSAFGGPVCGGATGNCSAGQVAMGVNIAVPAGCTFTVTATMTNRPGCSASGGDSGDQMKVDILGGSKPLLTTGSNGTLNDSYTLTGPGTIRVSGTANRADEIITYSTTSTGCVNCSPALPAELLRFEAFVEGATVACSWETASEINCDYFIVERSPNGLDFTPVGMLHGAGTSSVMHSYKLYDSSPDTENISYYRLAQTDFNGAVEYSEIRSVQFGSDANVTVFPNPSQDGAFAIRVKNLDAGTIQLRNIAGERIPLEPIVTQEETVFSVSGMAAGCYLLSYPTEKGQKTEKIVVQ